MAASSILSGKFLLFFILVFVILVGNLSKHDYINGIDKVLLPGFVTNNNQSATHSVVIKRLNGLAPWHYWPVFPSGDSHKV